LGCFVERLSAYSVVFNGDIKAGFDLSKVQRDFADLFNITPEKAQTILSKKRALKKDLDLETARAYIKRLESIGVDVSIIERKPELSASALALESTEKKLCTAEAVESPSRVNADPNIITCPKCQLEQPETEQCVGCGVYIHKVDSQFEEVQKISPQSKKLTSATTVQEIEKHNNSAKVLNLKVLSAATGAAIIGALLWKVVAMATNYEFSVMAWGIGGGIGFAAAAMGSRGVAIGVFCGVLALVAVIGGKYMVIQSFKSNWYEILVESGEFEDVDYKLAYQNTIEAAQAYQSEVTDDESLRQFMVDYGYSESSQANRVSSEEISVFKDIDEPILLNMAAGKLSYERWIRSLFQADFENASAIDLIKKDLDIIDVLFIFLGISTACRLGSGIQ